jgi:hydrogenase maturation protein HypF
MAHDIEMVRRYAEVNEEEEVSMLQHHAAPIVILHASGESLASGVAPGQNSLGFILPYTPLHHLLMLELDRPIVLTSGNRSEEPQCIDNRDAHSRLDGIADYYLLHDRDIVNRLDDSVVRFADGKPRFLRRARGYAPQSIMLPDGFADGPDILAMGGELKNSFCLLQQGRATVSQHMGDLEDLSTYRDYQHNLQLYRQLFDFTPQTVVVDKHPNYISSQLGRVMAADDGLQLLEVQHHHAHIASCMAEHGLPLDSEKVLGVALDGLGYGENGSIWGGEFLLADYATCNRLAHFQPAPMLGGAQAMYEPWRNTLAYLMTTLGWDAVREKHAELEIVSYLDSKPVANLQTMAQRGINSPMASSAGRLFDAVAAAVGVCRDSASYEGQAAIELEALAREQFQQQSDSVYGFDFNGSCIDWMPLWQDLLDELAAKVEPAVIAARFHHTLATAVAQVADGICEKQNIQTVVLSGGVFQNRLLLERTSQLLRDGEITVLAPQALPANDGGLSLGQAVIACARA